VSRPTPRATLHRHLAAPWPQRLAHRARRRPPPVRHPPRQPTRRPRHVRPSRPDRLRSNLTRAGWTAVDSRAVTVRLGEDPADATDYLADSGVGRAVLDTIPATDKPAALQAVTDALAPHTTNDGVHLDAAIWITTGTTMT
jgi:hypothetical protein